MTCWKRAVFGRKAATTLTRRPTAQHMTAIFQRILAVPDAEWRPKEGLRSILARFPKDGKGLYSKANLIAGYRHLIDEGDLEPDPTIMARIRMKPMRTASGVAPVTVLTAPAGCPAHCIFCPDDYRMPKSYIFDEPGCQRAERDGFDPFRQTLGRIEAFESIGHDASKVELLILGGTWSAYSRDYREWFVRRCFDAMNAAGNKDYVESTSLEEAQAINVTAAHRNVGLVIETRPDWITPEEIRHLRKLGVTKVQIGVQSLDDEILEMNKRGHKVAEVRHALGLLRTAGFKLHLHWMPNLYGATAESDHADFARFFSRPGHPPGRVEDLPLLADCGHGAIRSLDRRRISPLHRSRIGRPPGRCQAHHSAVHTGQPALPGHPRPPHPGRGDGQQPARGGPRRAGPPGHPLRLHPLPGDQASTSAGRRSHPAHPHLRNRSDHRNFPEF